MKNIYKILFAGLFLLTVTACSNDFLENEQFSTTPQNIESVEDLKALMSGAMIRSKDVTYYGRDMIVFGTVRGDVAFSDANSGRFRSPAYYNMISTDAYAADTFTQIYRVIGQLNVIINSTFQNASREAEIKNIKGQALVWRANAYLDLLKLYGQEHTGGTLGVPLILEYNTGADKPARATVAETHAQITADFEAGIALLEESGTLKGPKDLINYYSANGLAARYYLYKNTPESIQLAYDRASVVIGNTDYKVVGADLYLNSFSENLTSQNSIFEIAVGDKARLGTNSLAYIYKKQGYGDIRPVADFVNSFDAADIRSKAFTVTNGNKYVSSKYPDMSGNNSIKFLRFEEVLLTRAEANLILGIDPVEADNDVNRVVTNRGLAPFVGVTLAQVREQRKKELFFEGQTYWDMLRQGLDIPQYDPAGNLVDTHVYGQDPKLIFPIPQRELDVNKNIQPNPGF
ncbi:RagB/SusD family nutrient uptake outer membrane protein [uncultured Gelidibacter sp.]|uniref:RagB/SusD family nutrient uptake outer membrane protein n=1 Tax=uncultured Gelidibacter sp. TaxID=259318 RepID=UPI0026307072|nr:RagB/SusD family nutrient uptake outer membrane protein [uncultured Gelidibacter sp.]